MRSTEVGCPDWSVLLAERRPEADAPEVQRALDHLDDCTTCRRRALRIDPTLVFRRLPAADLSSTETEEMVRAVSVLRRTAEVGAESPKRSNRRLPRAAAGLAAASVVAAALMLAGGSPLGTGPDPASMTTAETPAMAVSLAGPARLEPVDLPLLDGLTDPEARVYQLDQDGLSVVMVVAETLDI